MNADVEKIIGLIEIIPTYVYILSLVTAAVLSYLRVFRILEFLLLFSLSIFGWNYFLQHKVPWLSASDAERALEQAKDYDRAMHALSTPAPAAPAKGTAPDYRQGERRDMNRLIDNNTQQ